MAAEEPIRKVLLLSSCPLLFQQLHTVLTFQGYEVVDQFDALMDFDALILDDFFALSGMHRLLEKEDIHAAKILIDFESSKQNSHEEMMNKVFRIPLEENLKEAVEHWCGGLDFDEMFQAQQFGKGLWVDMMLHFRRYELSSPSLVAI